VVCGDKPGIGLHCLLIVECLVVHQPGSAPQLLNQSLVLLQRELLILARPGELRRNCSSLRALIIELLSEKQANVKHLAQVFTSNQCHIVVQGVIGKEVIQNLMQLLERLRNAVLLIIRFCLNQELLLFIHHCNLLNVIVGKFAATFLNRFISFILMLLNVLFILVKPLSEQVSERCPDFLSRNIFFSFWVE
jgi:hypothetical protein